MIDIHCHILPALDDGPATIDESLNMCRIAYGDGIRKIVATPHFNESFQPGLADINAKISEVKKGLDSCLEIMPGNDIALVPLMNTLIAGKKVIPLNLKNYLLIELPDTFPCEAVAREISGIQSEGYYVIITHPERQEFFSYNTDFLSHMVKKGCLVQVTSSSITGGFGKVVQRFTRDLFNKKLVHIVSTDAHSDRFRRPVLSEAVDIAKRWIGKDAELMVTSIPEKVINGEKIEL
jgi:protein-tyrosine phosphatase